MRNLSVARHTLVQASVYAAVALLVLLILKAHQVLLAIFAGILLAVLIHGVATWMTRTLLLPRTLSLVIAIIGPMALLGAALGWMAPEIADQAADLFDRLPDALDQLRQRLLDMPWIQRAWLSTRQLKQLLPDTETSIGYATSFFAGGLGIAGSALFVLVTGIFIAISPEVYLRGALRLVPPGRRARARAVLDATADALRGWLIAKLIAMAVIGIITAAGLYLLGVELALVLGLIAALLSFIPNFGPVASAIPALLIALLDSPCKAASVAGLYTAVQLLESYGLTPLLQQRIVRLPPALLLTTQVLMGLLAGLPGIVLATPFTAAALVMVRMWYVENLLGDRFS